MLSTTGTSQIYRDPSSFKAIENLFLIFCHRIPRISGLNDCTALVQLGDKYDCLPCVSRAVQLHLLQLPTIWNDIKEKPEEYLVLAEKMRSAVILREAAIHVVGQWRILSEQLHGQISRNLLNTLDLKRVELDRLEEDIQIELLLLNLDSPKANFMDCRWGALALMRDGITRAFRTFNKCRISKIDDRILYKTLLDVGHLCEDKLGKMDRMWGEVDRIWREGFYHALGSLRGQVKDIIGEIMEVRTHPSVDVEDIGYLLCTKLMDAELPWQGDWP
jgi:hypothetical protein